MIMRITFLLLAALAIAAASPPNSVDEDIVPENAPIQMEHDQEAHPETRLLQEIHQEAGNRLKTLIQIQRKSENTCIKNAKKSIKSVIHEVHNAQQILNKMENGSRCAGKGQAALNEAKRSVAHKKAAHKKAKKGLNGAENARITVSVTFSSAKNNCNVFTSSRAWRKARRNVANKKKALTRAKQSLADAKKYLEKMKAKARSDRCKCKKRVTKQAKNAVTQARKLTRQRKRSIIRESMLICLVRARSKRSAKLRNNAGQACKNIGMAAKYNAKLALHKTKLVKMNFRCNLYKGSWLTDSALKERHRKERDNKERSSKQRERNIKERAQKAVNSERATKAARERASKESLSKERATKGLLAGRYYVQWGYAWRTLGGGLITGGSTYCARSMKTIPSGCHIAPDNWASRAMAKKFCWSTSVVVFSNGNSWGTKCYGGNHWNYNQLSTRYNQAKANNCYLDVLLNCKWQNRL